MQSFHLPENGESLSEVTISSLEAFSKACRSTIIRAVSNAGSGHPGGSLSSLEFLSLAYIIGSQTGEEVVVSNGHISAGVYSVLAELGYVNKEDLIKNFRKNKSKFEGHVNSELPGIPYTTGPLGCGVSVAAGMALAEKLKGNYNKRVFSVMGDGEAQEGQVWEMLNFASMHKLDNLVTFVDYNKVQLSGSMDDVMKTRIKKLFDAGDWSIDEIDGHDYSQIWKSIHNKEEGKPKLILGHTIMGKGVPSMENEGKNNRATWHGKAPSDEQAEKDLKGLTLDKNEENSLSYISGLPKINFKNEEKKLWKSVEIKLPKIKIYEGGEKEACRAAYGNTLRDIVSLNQDKVVVGTADLAGSVNTNKVEKEFQGNHIQFGIAEQNMVSAAGGLSLAGKIPVISTFANFGANRAKDQNRLNDVNKTNVKLICTHAGLSVGADGPTHQALDDAASMLGLPNTRVIEPADANLTAHLVQHALGTYGNVYMRMGRHKLDIITKEEDNTPYYDEDYEYEYGKTDIVRKGDNLTLVSIGSAATEALRAYNKLPKDSGVELIVATSYKDFDEKILKSVERTENLVVVEDHFTHCGLAHNIKSYLSDSGVAPGIRMRSLGPSKEYQLSGECDELYKNVGMDSDSIVKEIGDMLV